MTERTNKPVRSALAFVLLPQFHWKLPAAGEALRLLRPLLLIPLVLSGLLPRTAITEKTAFLAELARARKLFFENNRGHPKENTGRRLLQAWALISVHGFLLFCALALLSFLVAWLIPPAAAQDAPAAQDLNALLEAPGRSLEMIDAIFGRNSTGLSGDGLLAGGTLAGGTLGDMLLVYNAVVVFFGISILIYNLLYIFAETADQGPGGLRGGFKWFAIRSAIAVILMAPLPGGLSGGQHLVLALGDLGGSLATSVWSVFAQKTLLEENPISRPTVPHTLEGLIGQLLILETCTIAANKIAQKAGDQPYIVPKQLEVKSFDPASLSNSNTLLSGNAGLNQSYKRTLINYDGTTGSLGPRACGQVKFPFRNPERKAENADIILAHKTAFVQTRPRIMALANRLSDHFIPGTKTYGKPLPDPQNLIEQQGLAERWHDTLLKAAATARERTGGEIKQRIVEKINDLGWVGAGAWFLTLSQANGNFISSIRAQPTITLPKEEIETAIPAAAKATSALKRWLEDYRAQNDLANQYQQVATGLSDANNGIWDLLSEALAIEEILYGIVEANGAMPLSDLSAIGHTIITIALAGFGVIFGASFIPGVGGAISHNLGYVIWALFLPGVLLAYWLPLLPFIRFTFGLVAWLINLALAVICAPLFLLAHMGTDPGGFYAGITRPGYNMLLQLILRPALMVFGLILALLIFNAVIGLFNELFLPVLISGHDGSGDGLIGTIIMIILYCIIAYGIANMAFKMIDILPDNAVEWIGARGFSSLDNTGESGQQVAGGAARIERTGGNPRTVASHFDNQGPRVKRK